MRYVALGDSSTEGLADLYPDGSYRGWADRVADGLCRRDPTLLYANLAIRGRLSSEVEAEQLPAALALEPDVATVFAGVNDALRRSYDPERTEEALFSIMSRLREGGAEVVTITAPDLSAINPVARVVRSRLLDLNTRIRRAADYSDSRVVDVAALAEAADPRLWSNDRLHGSPAGHERIAHEILVELGERLAVPAPLTPLAVASRQAPWESVLWTAQHLGPWFARRGRGVSSGTGRTCKYPSLVAWAEVRATDETEAPAGAEG